METFRLTSEWIDTSKIAVNKCYNLLNNFTIYSFIHSEYLYSAPSRTQQRFQSIYGQREMSEEACGRKTHCSGAANATWDVHIQLYIYCIFVYSLGLLYWLVARSPLLIFKKDRICYRPVCALGSGLWTLKRIYRATCYRTVCLGWMNFNEFAIAYKSHNHDLFSNWLRTSSNCTLRDVKLSFSHMALINWIYVTTCTKISNPPPEEQSWNHKILINKQLSTSFLVKKFMDIVRILMARIAVVCIRDTIIQQRAQCYTVASTASNQWWEFSGHKPTTHSLLLSAL